MKNRQVETNIRVGYLLSFLIELYLPVAVWVFFYQQFMSYQQIAILAAFQLIVWNLFEVPTGAFADIFGRKKSILLAFSLYAVCMLIAAFSSNFWVFLTLEFFKGISNALNSGSLEALVYDSLKESGRESNWDTIVANNETLLWIGLFVGSISGGFLYHWWPASPYLFQGVIYGIAALVALQLFEPALDSKTFTLKNTLLQPLKGFKELFATHLTTYQSLLFAILGTGYVIAGNLLGISQAKQYGLDSRGVGLLFAGGYLLSALASQAYPRLRKKLAANTIILLVTIVLLFSFLTANFVGVILGSLLIIVRIASSTTYRNIRSSTINSLVNSKNRATSLSAMQLLTQLPFAISAIWIGGFIDKTSPNYFALILGVILLTCLMLNQIVYQIAKRKG